MVGPRLIRQITTADVADLLDRTRERGCSEKTVAGSLATLASVMGFAVRNGWIADNPVMKLERDERPQPPRREQKVLGREEIGRLLDACPPAYRALIATAPLHGPAHVGAARWDDVDLAGGTVHVRADLSRAHSGTPARRVAPKTPSSVRQIPLAPQLAAILLECRSTATWRAGGDWVFGTRNGTPH